MWKTHGNRLPIAVPKRSPPHEARGSPRPCRLRLKMFSSRGLAFEKALTGGMGRGPNIRSSGKSRISGIVNDGIEVDPPP